MSCLASEEMLGCTQCSLHQWRTQVVPGHGDTNAWLACVAEAPGAQEDAEGEPLVGRAGQRFDRHLAAVGLSREEVFLENTVHCRPPNNRLSDYPDALVRCPPLWLFPTLQELPNLRVVVAMGATAGGLWFPGKKAREIATLARAFLHTAGAKGYINKMHIARPYIVVGAWHPSHALRTGGDWNNIDESIVASFQRALTYGALVGVSNGTSNTT